MSRSANDTGVGTPVSILTNKSLSPPRKELNGTSEARVSQPRAQSQDHENCTPPSYRSVDSHVYVNPKAVSQKLKLVTSMKNPSDYSPGRSTTSNSSISNTPTTALKTPSIATAVSFTVPEFSEKISHRGSISTRPSSTALTNTAPAIAAATATTNANANTHGAITPTTSKSEDLNRSRESSNPSSRQNSIHMPGDFIYFESKNPLHPVTPSTPAAKKPVNHHHHHHHHHSNKAVIGSPNGPQVPFTEFFQKQDDGKIHILLGATGSVATIKVPLIIDKLFKLYTPEKVSVQLVVTKRAEHFLKGLKISTDVKIWRDEDEWFGFKRMGDPVLHTELRKWADIFLIAPLSANTLSKMANGICDNLLTSLIRTWTPSTPILVAPAMNTFMYIHPITKKHLSMLQEGAPYIDVLKPVEKVLVCGDIGMGGMREWSDVVEILVKRINEIRGSKEEEDDDEEGEAGTEDYEIDDEDAEDEDDTDSNDSNDDEDEDEDEDVDVDEKVTLRH